MICNLLFSDINVAEFAAFNAVATWAENLDVLILTHVPESIPVPRVRLRNRNWNHYSYPCSKIMGAGPTWVQEIREG